MGHMGSVSDGLKLGECVNFVPCRDLDGSVTHEKIKRVAAAFSSNIDRIQFQALVFPFVIYWSINLQTRFLQATAAVTGVPEFIDKNHPKANEVLSVFTEFKEAWMRRTAEEVRKAVEEKDIPAMQSVKEDIYGLGIAHINDVLDMGDQLTISGVQAMLLSMVTGAWTAFEVLSSDLWVAAVNARPNPFAVRFGDAVDGKGQAKSLTIPTLAKYADHNFNLSGVMGDVFRAEEKADFLSLDSTAKNYERTFGHKSPAFDAPDLRLLELVRHLIVHCGAIVDQKFIDRLGEKKLLLHRFCSSVEKTRPFHIDGEVTGAFIRAAISAGSELVKFVDGCLNSA
jgi:hypothetical protein